LGPTFRRAVEVNEVSQLERGGMGGGDVFPL
jgi:hypothetical protein